MSKQRIHLVTRADDAGSCNSANVAIWNCYRRGIVLNASVMVPAPAFEEAAELLGSEEGLCVGLHVTLTSEWESVRWGPVLPAEEVSSLVDEHGCFPRSRRALEDNGARLETYVIEGERGSGVICMNGAAARLIHEGDKVIVISYQTVSEADAANVEPTIVFVDSRNAIARKEREVCSPFKAR